MMLAEDLAHRRAMATMAVRRVRPARKPATVRWSRRHQINWSCSVFIAYTHKQWSKFSWSFGVKSAGRAPAPFLMSVAALPLLFRLRHFFPLFLFVSSSCFMAFLPRVLFILFRLAAPKCKAGVGEDNRKYGKCGDFSSPATETNRERQQKTSGRNEFGTSLE